MTRPGSPPDDSEVAAWIGMNGFEYWKQVADIIDQNYPGIFLPKWLFGGKKHGWSLRYKKSKTLCTLIPEKDRFAVLIVFGAVERQKVDAIKDQLSVEVQEEYEKATTYHDGKWVLLRVVSERTVRDVRLLFGVKQRPKHKNAA